MKCNSETRNQTIRAERKQGRAAKLVKRLLSKVAYWVNDTFPGVKSLVPKSLHRFVLLQIVGVNKGAYDAMLRENAERVFLQNEALPWIGRTYRKVLFVGTASYTYQYEEFFVDDPDRYHTIDRAALNKVWGAKNHIIASIGEVDRHRPAEFFDCIMLTGVLGYADPANNEYGPRGEELPPLLAALHRTIRPGGLLFVGWHLNDMPQSLHQLGLLGSQFKPTDRTPWGFRKDFPNQPYAFEFYERI